MGVGSGEVGTSQDLVVKPPAKIEKGDGRGRSLSRGGDDEYYFGRVTLEVVYCWLGWTSTLNRQNDSSFTKSFLSIKCPSHVRP